MKQQTFIAEYFTNERKSCIDFFRHSLKTIKGVIEKEKAFINKYKNNKLYHYLQDETARLEVWATPDGYNETECVYKANVKDLITNN